MKNLPHLHFLRKNLIQNDIPPTPVQGKGPMELSAKRCSVGVGRVLGSHGFVRFLRRNLIQSHQGTAKGTAKDRGRKRKYLRGYESTFDAGLETCALSKPVRGHRRDAFRSSPPKRNQEEAHLVDRDATPRSHAHLAS